MSANQTEITPYLEAEITPGKNLIYCATFQIVWNQLADEIIQAPIALAGNPRTAQALNKRAFEKDQLSESAYFAIVGFGRDGIVKKIEQGLKEKFDREPGVELAAMANDILSYAYLEKNLPFDTAFDVYDIPLPFNGETTVESFGIFKGDSAADQVVVLDYTTPDDFIIQLCASPKADEELDFGLVAQRERITDEVILAKVAPESTLAETVNIVFGRIAEEKFKNRVKNYQDWEELERQTDLLMPMLDSNVQERLQIPKISFDILQHFTELEGKQVLNLGFEPYTVAKAIQTVKFKLDETGAVLKSEGFMNMYFGASFEEPRHFIFDKPFLFCLREKGAQHPYFVVWIDNADLLVKA